MQLFGTRGHARRHLFSMGAFFQSGPVLIVMHFDISSTSGVLLCNFVIRCRGRFDVRNVHPPQKLVINNIAWKGKTLFFSFINLSNTQNAIPTSMIQFNWTPTGRKERQRVIGDAPEGEEGQRKAERKADDGNEASSNKAESARENGVKCSGMAINPGPDRTYPLKKRQKSFSPRLIRASPP